MHQEGHVAAQVSGQFALFGAQQESLRRPVGALLLPGCVHFFDSFSAVVQHHFAVPWRGMEIKRYSKPFFFKMLSKKKKQWLQLLPLVQ